MSGSFTGFSEDDIRKLNNKNPEEITKRAVKSKQNSSKRVSSNSLHANSCRSPQNSDELRLKILSEKIRNSNIEPILNNAKLGCSPALKQKADNSQCSNSDTLATPSENISPTQIASHSNKVRKVVETAALQSTNLAVNEKESAIMERKLDLHEFQAKQKLIEEQNKKRKELLIKALAVKTKQTQEETQRLNEIRDEFKKLDALLSGDVRILRKEIEVASLEYMEAQKKYYRIEKDFLDAKLALHQKLERKEMLTEHLCAIIEKNEERKAEKLNELLLKLNLKADVDDDSHCSAEQSGNNTEHKNDTVNQVDSSTKSENLENSK